MDSLTSNVKGANSDSDKTSSERALISAHIEERVRALQAIVSASGERKVS